jgi:hypothetical protein
MGSAVFEINITADGNTLCIHIKLPRSPKADALEALFARLFNAFDELDAKRDPLSRAELFETLVYSDAGDEHWLSVERSYTQPDYPERFEEVLRRLANPRPVLH